MASVRKKRTFQKQTRRVEANKQRDKLRNWCNVQDEILSVLKSKQEKGATAPSALQVYEELKHPNELNCVLYWRGLTTDYFVTYFPSSLHIWSAYQHGKGQLDIKVDAFPMKKISVLEYVPIHRMFVGFCPNDLTLCVFGDAASQFAEITSLKCNHTVLCLLYNRDTDRLLAGTSHSLLRFSLASVRKGLMELKPFELKLNQDDWIWTLKIHIPTKQLMVHCSNALFIINYKTEKITHMFHNRHSAPLTCTTFYPEMEYLFTAAKDGSIKVWSSAVFKLVHEFIGHYMEVTSLAIHRTEPLLISASLDSTIRTWRLETFQLHQRIDVGEPVRDLWIFNNRDIGYQTLNDIHIAHLNLYHTLFCITQSSVTLLSRERCEQLKNKIIAAAYDGSIRLLSPVSGMGISIIYPFANCEVIKTVLYRHESRKIYAFIGDNRVVVYCMKSNPAQPCYVLCPTTRNKSYITSVAKFHMDDHFEKNIPSASLIFVGYNDGSIDLIEAEGVYMRACAQAHQGAIIEIKASVGMCREAGPSIGQVSRLMSAGSDGVICVWEVQCADMFITLGLITKVKYDVQPDRICMMGAILAYTEQETGFLQMYSFTEEKLQNGQIRTIATKCHHESHDNHKAPVVGMDCCPSLRLFVTVAGDGFLKVWDTENKLVREIPLEGKLHSVCFANERGDLLVGFRNHIYIITLSRYLPGHILKKIVTRDFRDDVREEPKAFNRDLKLWFNPDELPHYPIELLERRQILEPEAFCSDSETDLVEVPNILQFNKAELRRLETLTKEAPRKNSPATIPSFSKPSSRLRQRRRSEGQADLGTPATKRPRALAIKLRHSGLATMINVQGKATISLPPDAELPRLEDGRLKYPIAPDGYVPNSCVRAQMSFKPTPTDTFVAKERWKPKPIKLVDIPNFGDMPASPESVRTPFTWASSVETPREDLSLPSSAASTPRAPTADGIGGKGDKGGNKLKERQEKLRQQRLAKARAERTTGSAVTATKVDIAPRPLSEAPSDATGANEEDQPIAEEQENEPVTAVEVEVADTEDSPDLVPAVLQDLSREPWWPQDAELSVHGAVDVFSRLLDTEPTDTFSQICDYIVRIHNELEYTDDEREQLIRKLLTHTKNPDAQKREKAFSTLGSIGHKNSQSLVRAMAPGLLDKEASVRKAAAIAIQKITGLSNIDDLMKYLDDADVLSQLDGKVLLDVGAPENKDEVYAALLEALGGDVAKDTPADAPEDDTEENSGKHAGNTTTAEALSKGADILTIDYGQEETSDESPEAALKYQWALGRDFEDHLMKVMKLGHNADQNVAERIDESPESASQKVSGDKKLMEPPKKTWEDRQMLMDRSAILMQNYPGQVIPESTSLPQQTTSTGKDELPGIFQNLAKTGVLPPEGWEVYLREVHISPALEANEFETKQQLKTNEEHSPEPSLHETKKEEEISEQVNGDLLKLAQTNLPVTNEVQIAPAIRANELEMKQQPKTNEEQSSEPSLHETEKEEKISEQVEGYLPHLAQTNLPVATDHLVALRNLELQASKERNVKTEDKQKLRNVETVEDNIPEQPNYGTDDYLVKFMEMRDHQDSAPLVVATTRKENPDLIPPKTDRVKKGDRVGIQPKISEKQCDNSRRQSSVGKERLRRFSRTKIRETRHQRELDDLEYSKATSEVSSEENAQSLGYPRKKQESLPRNQSHKSEKQRNRSRRLVQNSETSHTYRKHRQSSRENKYWRETRHQRDGQEFSDGSSESPHSRENARSPWSKISDHSDSSYDEYYSAEEVDDGIDTEGSKEQTEEEYTPKLPQIIRRIPKDDSSGISDSGVGKSSDASAPSQQDKTSSAKEAKARLSPIKSEMLDPSLSEPPENWRDFFETDSAKERRSRKELQAAAAAGGAGSGAQELPPIQYSAPKPVLIHGDAGVRMVQSVTITTPRSGKDSPRKYRIQPIPGKLGIQTHTESGSTRYGVIDMQWTSGVPFVPSPPTEERLPHLSDHQHSYDNRLALSGNNSSSYLPDINSRGRGQGQSARGPKVKDSTGQVYEWDGVPHPPPASHRPTRPVEPKIHRGHSKHHCDYYRFIKKGMAQHINQVNDRLYSPDTGSVRMRTLKTLHNGALRHEAATKDDSSSSSSSSSFFPPVTFRTLLTAKA